MYLCLYESSFFISQQQLTVLRTQVGLSSRKREMAGALLVSLKPPVLMKGNTMNEQKRTKCAKKAQKSRSRHSGGFEVKKPLLGNGLRTLKNTNVFQQSLLQGVAVFVPFWHILAPFLLIHCIPFHELRWFEGYQ